MGFSAAVARVLFAAIAANAAGNYLSTLLPLDPANEARTFVDVAAFFLTPKL